jgi:hypothetical protein
MPIESSEPKEGGNSRRSFLVKLGLGVAGLAGISTGLVRFGKKEISAMSQEFPGPDSIFHPARDPRTDPRRQQ